MTGTIATPAVRTTSALAIPLLGILAAVQGSAPNIAATALVGASRGLDMVGGDQALAASMQALAIAASVISTGLLADRIGRRRMLIAALVTSLIGQLIVALATVPAIYILGQAVSGVGLGAVYAAAFAYIQVLAAPGRLPAAVATFVACSGAASVLFTFSGGMLAGVDWRFAFMLVPLLLALSIPAVLALLPAVPPSVTERRDIWGPRARLGHGRLPLRGLAARLVADEPLHVGRDASRTGAPRCVRVVADPRRAPLLSRRALSPPALSRRPVRRVRLQRRGSGRLLAALEPLAVRARSRAQLGRDLAASRLGTSIVGAIVLGRLMTRGMTAQRSLLLGGLLTAAGFTLAFFVRDATTPLAFVPAGTLVALGLTAAALPYGTLVLGEAPAEFYGPVTSSRTTFGQLFYSLGTAVSTVVVTQVTIAGITSRLHATGMTDAAVSSALASVGTYAKDGVRPDAAVFDIATAAYRDGFGAVMIGMAVIALVASIVGALLIRRAARHA
ncbi:MFS transporter [Microbacterium paulum]